MNDWHSLIWGMMIQENGGLFYVKVWARGSSEPEYGYYYHEWVMYDREEVFAYADWCDMYCDGMIHSLLIK